MGDYIIELKGVTKKFGKNTVLSSIDLNIPEGKITAIIGASGEGKSTILKLITSFYQPTKGKIYYSKNNIFKNITRIKKEFGSSIESGSFYDALTIKENLMYFGRLYKVDSKTLKKRVNRLMHFINLYNARNVYAKNISLGMKKRLDLACALINNPKVLILDEPTADLDPLLRNQMLKIVKRINKNGTTVIFTTQLLEEVDEFCDNVAILYNEKIIEHGKVKNIKKKHHCSNMNCVFEKIFSRKGRKSYQESIIVKTKLETEQEKKRLILSLMKKKGKKHRRNKK